eukprot:gnl/TRDRNA2_/TRDRNA2_148086_c0_seq1.p1 gnl/TRDRNA2_/TRDRNA2_148086_c0~~gnl/TRDRNA2_/TRDRNA2_148086_c0_seq1.p1  ORF type:complete len:826 (-),score=104.95 gnl/TRDRNA2_/TRDRNA2_148086_c0_seq1:65-2542(-)
MRHRAHSRTADGDEAGKTEAKALDSVESPGPSSASDPCERRPWMCFSCLRGPIHLRGEDAVTPQMQADFEAYQACRITEALDRVMPVFIVYIYLVHPCATLMYLVHRSIVTSWFSLGYYFLPYLVPVTIFTLVRRYIAKVCIWKDFLERRPMLAGIGSQLIFYCAYVGEMLWISLQMSNELMQHQVFLTAITPAYFAVCLGYVPFWVVIGAICPVNLLVWLVFHARAGFLQPSVVILGFIYVGASMHYFVLVERSEWRHYKSRLALDRRQRLQEATQVAFKGLLATLFDASCICDAAGSLVSCTPQFRLLLTIDGDLPDGGAQQLGAFASSGDEEERLRGFLKHTASFGFQCAVTIQTSLRQLAPSGSVGEETGNTVEVTLYGIVLPDVDGDSNGGNLFIGLRAEPPAGSAGPSSVRGGEAAAGVAPTLPAIAAMRLPDHESDAEAQAPGSPTNSASGATNLEPERQFSAVSSRGDPPLSQVGSPVEGEKGGAAGREVGTNTQAEASEPVGNSERVQSSEDTFDMLDALLKKPRPAGDEQGSSHTFSVEARTTAPREAMMCWPVSARSSVRSSLTYSESQISPRSSRSSKTELTQMSWNSSSKRKKRFRKTGAKTAACADASTQTSLTAKDGRPPISPSSSEPQHDGERVPRRVMDWLHRSAPSPQKRNVELNSSRLILPTFAETPQTSSFLTLHTALGHANARGSGCCPWHIACARLHRAMKVLIARKCMPDFSPYKGWQCAACLSMHYKADDEDLVEFENDSDDSAEGCRRGPLCSICYHVGAQPPRAPAADDVGSPREPGTSSQLGTGLPRDQVFDPVQDSD